VITFLKIINRVTTNRSFPQHSTVIINISVDLPVPRTLFRCCVSVQVSRCLKHFLSYCKKLFRYFSAESHHFRSDWEQNGGCSDIAGECREECSNRDHNEYNCRPGHRFKNYQRFTEHFRQSRSLH